MYQFALYYEVQDSCNEHIREANEPHPIKLFNSVEEAIKFRKSNDMDLIDPG